MFSQPDKIGQPLTVTDNAQPVGKVTHFRYDLRGNMLSARDALNYKASALYNLADQPVAIALPMTNELGPACDTTVLTYPYPGGPLIKSQLYDETGTGTPVRTVNYGYGNEGEFKSRSGDTEAVTQTYDPMMRLSTVADAKAQTTKFVYQPAGEAGYLAQIQYPNYAMNNADTVSFPDVLYDGAGRPTERMDGNGVATQYVYGDDTGALTKIVYPAQGMTPNPSNVTLTYDDFGRVKTMADGAGMQTYTYDDLNNITSVATSYNPVAGGHTPPSQTFTYAFNPNGSRASLATSVGTFTYSYDPVGRMAGLTNPESEASSWLYQDNNWLASQTLGNQVYTAYQYNQIGDLKELTNYKTQGGAVLTDFGGMNSLKHDGPGNPLGYTATAPPYSGTSSYSFTPPMSMPFQEQLTQETSNRPSNGQSNTTNQYQYDLAGNLTLFKSGLTQSYNADNQNTALTGYDNNGSPYYRQSQALRYDPENRLTSVGANWTYGYTGDGLRAWKANNNVPTFFYYDGAVPVLETDQNGNVQAVNTYGPNGLLSRHTSSGTVYYTFDLQGSVTQRLNSSGGLIDNHLFDAFGTEISPKAAGDPFAFGSQWGYTTDQATSSDTGLLLCTWRYYDPLTGRFLTRDPIGYAGGLNLYEFAGNNPVSYADPSGTNPIICGAVGAGIGALISGGVAYVHHQNVVRAVVRGATIGGVTGFFTCLGAPELGAGFLGGAASGAVGGAIGDSAGQLTAIAFGWQDCFNWPEVLASSAFGGATGGLTNVLGGAGGAVPEGTGCFVAGTPLVQADGSTRPIEQVRVGDLVRSKDPTTGSVEAKRVLRTFVRWVNETLVLTFANGERIETTANHPFAVDGHGFVQAGKLGIGSLIVTRAGPATRLVKAERKVGRVRVYNLEVEGFHSYFVGTGDDALCVHNAPCFTAQNQAVADYLGGLGRDVTPNPLEGAEGAGRQGDAYVDGVLHEFKTLDPGADSATIRNVVRRSVKGAGQGRNIVIDARGSGLSLPEAQRGIARSFGAYGDKLDRITVIGDEFFYGGGR